MKKKPRKDYQNPDDLCVNDLIYLKNYPITSVDVDQSFSTYLHKFTRI